MNIIIAGVLSGVAMAIVMGIGEMMGWVRVNLPRVDGQFFFKDRFNSRTTYLFGLAIHLVTSVGFALGYFVFKTLLPITLPQIPSGLIWALILWIAFGLTVSPVTGYGLFGARVGKFTWLELLLTHCVFGLVLCHLM